MRPGRRARRRPWRRRGSSMRRWRPGSATATTVTSSSSSVAVWRCSTVTTTGVRTSTSRAAPNPLPSTATWVSWAARSHSNPCRTPRPISDRSRVPIRWTSTVIAGWTWPSFASVRTSCCGGLATAASSGRTRHGGSTEATAGRRPSVPPGKVRRRSRPWRWVTTSSCRSGRMAPSSAPTTRSSGRRRGDAVRGPDPAGAGLVQPVHAVQRLGSLRPTGPADLERSPLLPGYQ